MSKEAAESSQAEWLAAEFAEALRLGENPSVDEFVARYPEGETELREMLLTILAMEQLKDQNRPASPPNIYGSPEIKRLGDLRIVREIGRGGMGIVYEAVQESLGRTVAVKVLPKHRLGSDKALARFQRESKTAAKLHHTNIVPVLGVGTDEGYHYYVMQFIRGVGLDEVIGHLRSESSERQRRENPTPDLSSVARKLIERTSEASTVAAAPTHSVTVTAPGETAGETIKRPSSPNANPPTLHQYSRRFDRAYWRSLAWIAHRVAAALQYAHDQGVLHRDIKPSNLLVDSTGEVSVADFGLAKSIDQAGISRSGDVVGTLRYMAPEQLTGAADHRSDVYSLGVTLYELATLKPAWDDSQLAGALTRGANHQPLRPSQICREIPGDLETIIVKAMSTETSHRYQSAAELSDDLRRFFEDRPILAKRASTLEHAWRWSRRNPIIATLCAVSASLLVAVAAISTTAYYRTNQARQVVAEQRNIADQTAESAFEALDEIFHRLAPMPMVNPGQFAGSSNSQSEPLAAPKPTKRTAALLEKLLTFYGRIAAAGQTNDRYRSRLAEAHHRIGDIRQRLGQVDVAVASYDRSVELYRELLATEPSPRVAARLAAAHNDLGICLHYVRRQRTPLPGAQSTQKRSDANEYRAAQMLLEPIATAESPPEVRYELARTYYLLGDLPRNQRYADHPEWNPEPGSHESLIERGNSRDQPTDGWDKRSRDPYVLDQSRDGAVDHNSEMLQKATDMLRQLVTEYPESPDYQRLLAMCYLEISKGTSEALSERGHELRLDAIELLRNLAEGYPENADYRFALSSAYASGRVTSPHLDRDAISEYIERLEMAETLITQLRTEFPDLPQYLLAHLKILRQLGVLHRRLEGRSAELLIYRKASEVCRGALPDAITNISAKSVIEIYDRTAELLMAEDVGDVQQHLTEASLVLKAGLEVFESLTLRSSDTEAEQVRSKFLSRWTDVRDRLERYPLNADP